MKLKLDGVKETALYVANVMKARAFYETVFGQKVLDGDDRFCALSVADQHVLLLFKRGASTKSVALPGGTIPGHDGSGQTHVGFSVHAGSLKKWEARLKKHGVKIESRMKWWRGGTSLYFRDPDGHLLELLTPGVWEIY